MVNEDRIYRFNTGSVHLRHSLVTGEVDITCYATFNTDHLEGVKRVVVGYDSMGKVISTGAYLDVTPPECPGVMMDTMKAWEKVVDLRRKGVNELQFLHDGDEEGGVGGNGS